MRATIPPATPASAARVQPSSLPMVLAPGSQVVRRGSASAGSGAAAGSAWSAAGGAASVAGSPAPGSGSAVSAAVSGASPLSAATRSAVRSMVTGGRWRRARLLRSPPAGLSSRAPSSSAAMLVLVGFRQSRSLQYRLISARPRRPARIQRGGINASRLTSFGTGATCSAAASPRKGAATCSDRAKTCLSRIVRPATRSRKVSAVRRE